MREWRKRFSVLCLVCGVSLMSLLSGCSAATDSSAYVGEMSDMIAEDGKLIAEVSWSPYAVELMPGVQGTKLSTHSPGETVHPGSEIGFAIVISNESKDAVTVTIEDVVPDNTEYVSGCDDVDGTSLKWELTVSSGEKAYVSYVVRVKEDMSLCDGGFVYSEAIVNGFKLSCNKVLIKRTFNQYDQEKILTGIQALTKSEFGGIELAKSVYTIAFSNSFAMNGTAAEILEQIYVAGGGVIEGSAGSGEELPEQIAELSDMVVPTLFGGKAVENNADGLFPGQRTEHPTENDLITGDILLLHQNLTDEEQGEMYIYDGSGLLELLDEGAVKADTQKIIDSLTACDRFVVLRPSFVLEGINYTDEPEVLVLTPEQEALVETAKSYLLRGGWIQYEDTRLGTETVEMEHRWQKGLKAPEDYTSDEWGYTNCAAFAYDVYQFALGYDIKMYTTWDLIQANEAICPYLYKITGDETEAEKQAIEQEFKNTLQPGDIIVMRRTDGSGHAMLYVGNGDIIHSSGKNYDYDQECETYEPTVRYFRVENLFRPQTRYALFHAASSFAIVRPLNTWTEGVPENTVNRVQNLKGIVAEKLSSHTSGTTVSSGGEVTFTFSVYNTNGHEVQLEIKDIVPENTTYVSGAETIEQDVLSWQVTVPPGETVCVSYTVKVNEDDSLPDDGYIYSEAGTVGGVSVKCPKIYIGRSLSEEEQTKLVETIRSFADSELRDIELVNAIYEKAFGVSEVLGSKTVEELAGEIFEVAKLGMEIYRLKVNGQYTEMVAPTLYGGRGCYTSPLFEKDRSRLVREQHLMVGDILLARDDSGYECYLYNGECLLDITNGLREIELKEKMEQILAYEYYYVVLRPSAAME